MAIFQQRVFNFIAQTPKYNIRLANHAFRKRNVLIASAVATLLVYIFD